MELGVPCVSGYVWMTRLHERVGYVYEYVNVYACVCVSGRVYGRMRVSVRVYCEGLWGSVRVYLSGIVHSVGGYT